MRSSPPNQPNDPFDLERISDHTDLSKCDEASHRSAAYAELCAKRQIEIREHELRAYVVRRSVRRIDCVAGVVVLMMIGLGFLGIVPISWEYPIESSLAFAALVVATSARSIAAAVNPRSSR